MAAKTPEKEHELYKAIFLNWDKTNYVNYVYR